ncbi:hypothetical protein Nepgr_025312 [Nepenthes gracilis]|uniref:Acyl carrier protein n=1 Tax=Nepenthes gracilis TaxID=150966 RepID=A0AAD3T641_NEPGR|nr:hypothetical protein Nepgr_025312 [Nepenthes gracilis]
MAAVSANSLRLQPSSKLFIGTSRVTNTLTMLQSLSQVNGRSSAALSFASLGWKRRSFPSLSATRLQISCAAKPETVQKVCDIVRKQLALPPESELAGDSKFSSLGADSLDTVEIVMELEEEFGISVEEESSQSITTVQEAADLIEKLVQNKAKAT